MFTFGSLFSGIGGIDLGLERAGMVCCYQAETDPDCRRWLAYHWPDVRRYEDVRNCGKHNLEPTDLIAGGFPCQPHSVAGKRRGAADDRNLWPEFIRIIREIQPRYVLAENVPGIVTTYLDTVLSDLENEAYTCWTFNIPACAFDAPHLRKRIFIVAHADKGCGKPTQKEICPGRDTAELRGEDVAHTSGQRAGSVPIRSRGSHKTTGNFDGGCTDVPHTNSERLQGGRISGATGDRSQDVEDPQRNGSRTEIVSCQAGGENPARPASRTGGSSRRPTQSGLGMLVNGLPTGLAGRWLPEPSVGRIATGVPDRVAKLRALGNAVVPQVAEWIGRQILATHREKT